MLELTPCVLCVLGSNQMSGAMTAHSELGAIATRVILIRLAGGVAGGAGQATQRIVFEAAGLGGTTLEAITAGFDEEHQPCQHGCGAL